MLSFLTVDDVPVRDAGFEHFVLLIQLGKDIVI